MLIKSEIKYDQDIQDMLEFYRHNFDCVEVVKCEACGEFIAIMLSAPKTGDYMGLTPNEIGKCVVDLGNRLMSSRVRLDHAPNGERMIGFQCVCENRSLLSEAEMGLVPVSNTVTHLSPFEKHKIMKEIANNKNYISKFKQIGKTKIFDEKFSVEVID